MEAAHEGKPRTYCIKRSQHLGYGFIAGYERPTMVKIIEPNGPSYKRLIPGDVIMAVNGIDVEAASREKIIKMIQLCDDQIEIKVRQPTYQEIIRAKNLADPKFYMFNKTTEQTNANTASTNNIDQNHHQMSSPSFNTLSSNDKSPLDRLVTSISHQKLAPFLTNNTNNVLKQRTDDLNTNLLDIDGNNNHAYSTNTLGRNGFKKHGSDSSMPQRCKSSMDGTKTLKTGNKKLGDIDNDQPMLKRSNTMRPIRPCAKVMEIFEVVIKIFFEDGHTRVLVYNQNTTVDTILETLNTRLVGSSPHADQLKRYFGLALTVHSDGKEQQTQRRKLLHILDDKDSIMKIRQLPYAPKLRLLYRMVYPPSDVVQLYIQDKKAFEYLYKQSCNDLKEDRFYPELEGDIAFKLGALHLVEYVYSNHPKAHGSSKDPKVYMRLVKKAPGLNHFLPESVIKRTLDSKGKKKLKVKLTEQLRKNFEEFDFEPPKVKSTTNLNRYTSTSFHELSLPEFKSSPSDYVKLMFLCYLSQLPCYGNTKKPLRASASPIERNSVGECSSSLESVPRTSDSSPLIKLEPNQANHQINGNRTTDNSNHNTISRLAQINSMRSLSTSQSQAITNVDQPDMAQTPSMESISSITFNMQSTPSPQQAPSFISHKSDGYTSSDHITRRTLIEPSPMPRQQIPPRLQDYNSIERLYNQRYSYSHKSVDELLKTAIILPPPPISDISYHHNLYNNHLSNRMIQTKAMSYVTPVLSDQDLERLKVPPPPKLKY